LSPNKKSHIAILSTSYREYDRRIQRISCYLDSRGHQISWLSRSYEGHSDQISQWFKKGISFYLEFNIRLIVRLFSVKPEVIYAVDLDTMLAAKIYSVLRRLPLVYDSHEYFTEVPELSGRPLKKAIWTAVGKWAINENTQCITVNHSLAQLLEEKYGVPFTVIRNIPPQVEEIHFDLDPTKEKKIIVYLGAVNEGRGIELYCQAAHEGYLDDYDLWIIGNGDLLPQLLNQYKKQKNIVFYDWVAPDQLSALLSKCWIGLNLLDAVSQSYYYSLTNKYFDYCHHGLPALHMDYPEYRQLQKLYLTSYLVPSYDLKALLKGIQHFEDPAEYKKSKLACKEASLDLNWENESQKLNEISDSL